MFGRYRQNLVSGKFSVHRRQNRALRSSNGRPVLKVVGKHDEIYLAVDDDIVDIGSMRIEILDEHGTIVGSVSVKNLCRLVNADHAIGSTAYVPSR